MACPVRLDETEDVGAGTPANSRRHLIADGDRGHRHRAGTRTRRVRRRPRRETV